MTISKINDYDVTMKGFEVDGTIFNHGRSAFTRLTMSRPRLDWTDELERWLAPFLDTLGHSTRPG